ncbi:hypothetical protein HYDPIDRAFT_111309 [Hydnomerulius pinastri MD-312]|uniref:Uncharacterized protein n=1 Tax=Hydnomerulius pinastri MD-312 TaxID=994086 RepID=A0A0C9WA39_9AGAM|nr:hypothetical protein HYDPIDRAFT_111309 [Hydnomerulius pinastri MD-312]
MNTRRAPPSGSPPAYRYVSRYYGRNLRPVVLGMSVVTALWSLAWTVTSFKELKLDRNDNLPMLAPLAIAQGVMFAVACGFQIFGVTAAAMQRFALVKIYAFLCALSTLLVVGVGFMRTVTHFTFKADLIQECEDAAKSGTIGSVFGIWGSNPSSNLTTDEATSYCNDQWNHDSWAEIIVLLVEIVLGLLFTSIAFAYYRQTLDPTSPINASRAPSNQVRMDDYPTHYSPPYDTTAYAPAYAPPPGSPPFDGKPPDYKRGSYVSYGEDKDGKEDDPFSDYDGPSVPMPTHWAEERDVTSSRA